jgi:hypothetical protein
MPLPQGEGTATGTAKKVRERNAMPINYEQLMALKISARNMPIPTAR